MEGHYSPTTPYLNRSTHSRVRWRPDFNEFQCDDCASSIQNIFPEPIAPEEGEVEHIIEQTDNDESNETIKAGQGASSLSESEV